ncbi:LOW QUALITY PROTEIN: hypothetical protein V2J09_022328 [Rumex salicifolius]
MLGLSNRTVRLFKQITCIVMGMRRTRMERKIGIASRIALPIRQPAPKKAKKNYNCDFCKIVGRIQKDCIKCVKWFEKKGKPMAFNLIILDGLNLALMFKLDGFPTTQNISLNEAYLYMESRMKSLVEAIGSFRLVLSNGFHLDLENTCYVPTIFCNLIFLSILDNNDFCSYTGCGRFSLFKNDGLVCFGIFINGLYLIILDNFFSKSLNVTLHPKSGLKRSKISERVDHISREMINFLVKEEILLSLEFTDFSICTELRTTKLIILRKDPQEKFTLVNLRDNWVDRRKSLGLIEKGWRPSLRHIYIRGCPKETTIYNPHEKKLDLKTISGFFIGYLERSKGIVDAIARFIENDD